ncbi:MAG: Fe-S cluster assembly protein HesB [Actinobacteria bacterium]|nr:Fe-S cluster assembly protein HesB [Actinomycetota bacterium]
MRSFAELMLHGPAGEPVDLRRTLLSHGVAALPPATLDEDGRALTVTLPAASGPRTVRISGGRAEREGAPRGAARRGRDGPAVALLSVADTGPPPAAAEAAALAAASRRVLCLDDDLSAFYAQAAADPDLAWVCAGAGRMLRSPTVFEDVVKTVCTTNCSWSATERMVAALVEHLGEPAPGAPGGSPAGRAFPTATRMAEADEGFYREVARSGYRGPRLRALALAVAAGELDLEPLLTASPAALPDDEVERRLLEIPGVGPYAAAHVMMLVGRHSRLVLDSWTRPKYARLMGKPPGTLVADGAIGRRFGAYGACAGLAFWLFVTEDWVDEPGARRPPT